MTKPGPHTGRKGVIGKTRAQLTKSKNQLRKSAMEDLTIPSNRRRAIIHFQIHDHASLRIFWANFAQVAEGVFRGNHPGRRRLEHYAKRGITTIINLRGASHSPHYAFEEEACRDLNLTLINNELTARSAPSRESLQSLIKVFRTTQKPFLFHCKSGADRSSLAAAIYLLVFCDVDIATARKQFSIRFIHFKWTKTGVLDHILDHYEAAWQGSGILFEDWIETTYDPAEIQASFDRRRKAFLR